MPKERIAMQVNIEQLSSVKKKLNFEIPAEHVQAVTQKAFAEITSVRLSPASEKGRHLKV